MKANITAHTEMLRTLQHKIKNQEISCKSISKLKQQTEANLEDVMKELHEARSFMSNLSEEVKETKVKEQIHDNKIQEISHNFENYLEQRDLIAKQNEQVEILKKDIERITDELEKSSSEIRTKDCEIAQLREFSETANEIVKEKDKGIVRAIGVEDFQRCIEIVLGTRLNIDDEGVRAFWSVVSTELQYMGWSSKKEYTFNVYRTCENLTGPDFIASITGILSNIEVTTAECVAFWEEY